MASTYIYRNHSASNRKTWTWSAWVKLGSLLNNQSFFTARVDNANYQTIRIEPDRFHIFALTGGGFAFQVKTHKRLRDPNCWYHLLVAFDTTQGTAANRVKMYVNGVQETELAESSYPSQNYDGYINIADTHYLGQGGNLGDKFDGSMSHVHFTDGTAYTPSSFGSTDTATGEWKINTSPTGLSYGTNGFFILKNSNSTTDQSGQTNNWTVSGNLTTTQDCPSNAFCSFNPSDAYLNYTTLTNANLTLNGGSQSVNYSMIRGTLGALSGKFYWEVKAVDNAEIDQVGVALTKLYLSGHASSGGLQSTAWGGKGVQLSNGNKVGDGAQSAYMGGFSANEVLCIALDLDNTKITFGRNGQWADGSGNANQTYANSTPAYTNLTAGEFYLPAHAQRDSAGNNAGISQYNFGNGYFGTTAVSSAGTNASNNGIFEYDVPSGFTALSTKGLNL